MPAYEGIEGRMVNLSTWAPPDVLIYPPAVILVDNPRSGALQVVRAQTSPGRTASMRPVRRTLCQEERRRAPDSAAAS